MSAKQKIEPDRITKPMQLLAAWLVGLILVDGAFLAAAASMDPGSWERGALVLASIGNVPIFLIALFILQTRFRPELQEDSYYAKYLNKRTNTIVTIGRDTLLKNEIESIRNDLRLLANEASAGQPQDGTGLWGTRLKIGLNRHLAELRQALRGASVPLDDYFGSDEAPEMRAMAIAEYLSFDNKLRLLRLAVDLELDGYLYFDPQAELIRQDVLIGAYGVVEFAVTLELEELLANAPEPADLRLYEEQNAMSLARSPSE